MPVPPVVEEEQDAIAGGDASRATATTDDKPAAAASTDTKPQSATEFVRQRREEIRAKQGAAPAAKPDAAASANADDADKGDKAAPTKPAAEQNASALYSDDELAEIVESGKDLRNVNLKRVPPALRATLTKMQTAERKRFNQLSAKERELEEKLKSTATVAPKKDDEDDDDALPDAEYKAIFGTKKGRAMLERAIEDVYGVKPEDLKAVKEDRSVTERQKVVNGAIFMAQKSHPEMKEDAFFDQVIDAIEADDELKEAFESNRNNATVMASVMKAGALKVKLKAATSEKSKVEKDKEAIKRAKEAQNAKPASMAARTDPKARASTDMSTADFVRNRRAQIRGQA